MNVAEPAYQRDLLGAACLYQAFYKLQSREAVVCDIMQTWIGYDRVDWVYCSGKFIADIPGWAAFSMV